MSLRSNATSFLFGIICIFSSLSSSAPSLPPEIHDEICATVTHVFENKHKDAQDNARHLIRKFPENPAGYFCMAFAIDNWMSKYETDKREDEFYRYCDLAIQKGEKLLNKNSKDEWARFFIAGADGFKGTYEARYERWITAFRFGWKSVSVLLELDAEGCDIPDIQYGIAHYNYWRSAMMKKLWWMPGIDDKREEAIESLSELIDKSIYIGPIVAASYIDILLNEERYQEAFELAEKQTRKYPKYAPYMWKKTKAEFGLKKYQNVITSTHHLLEKCNKYNPNNHYLEVVYHSYLAKTYYLQDKYSLALTEANILSNIEVKGIEKKRLEPIFDEIKGLKKKIIRAFKKR